MFDFPLTQWIRSLPVLNQIVFTKYPILSVAFCLAILVGTLVDGVMRSSLSYKRISWTLLLFFILFIALPTFENPARSLSFYFANQTAMYIALGYIVGMSLTMYILAYLGKGRLVGVPILQFALLLMAVSAPFWLGAGIQRPDRVDPYQPPRFLQFLKNDQDTYRIMGLDGILYPNISTAYNISDVRWLNAVILRRAYDFSVHLIRPDEPFTMRFTGTVVPISDRIFSLLNVKYVLRQNPAGEGPADCGSSTGSQYRKSPAQFWHNHG